MQSSNLVINVFIFLSFFVSSSSGLVTEMIQATGDLCNGIVKEGSIPEDWKSSVVLPIYKGTGDPTSVDLIEGLNCWNML